ncbi:MAG: 3-oxoacyl-ACP reductase family protein [Desulfobacteraceae bacterium]|jgi:3-oxoacyl-[acyl-carrier protein] reductase
MTSLNEMENRLPVALVTGGGKGIGAACCKALAQNGFYVVIHHNQSRSQADDLLTEIKGQGLTVQADLREPRQIDAMVDHIKKTVGKIDVLVNNAGLSVNGSMATMSLDDFDCQRSLTRGVWYLIKRVLRVFMIRQKQGRIIMMSSVTAHTGNSGHIPYTMEKAAMDALTKSLSKELAGSEILVNSVAPGFIETDMTHELSDDLKETLLSAIPLGRMGRPAEVAQVVSFLATSGTYINGSVIHVNGGMYGG